MTRKGRHPLEFRQMAVERMKRCENIVALSEELGVSRRLLYRWRDQLDPIEGRQEPPPESPRESTLRKENHQLKRALADKTLEVYLNLASRMKLTGVNQLWVAGITYIRLHREFVYLAVIL